MSLITRCAPAVLLLAALTLRTAGAHAQSEPTATETAAARQLFQQGTAAARGGDWGEARDAFQRSYELAPRPVTLFNLAGAQAETGRYVAATESYRRFLATAESRDQQRYGDAARAALSELEAQLGGLTIHVENLQEGDQVSLDASEISSASLDLDLPVDPGDHVIDVLRDGQPVAQEFATVGRGEHTTVRLTLVATPAEAAATVPDEPVTPASEDLVASPWFWVGVGAGVAVVAAIVIVVAVVAGGSPPPAPFVGNLGPGTITFD